MAISSAPKAASKLLNIGATSLQGLLRPSAAAAAAAAATHLFQSPATTISAVATDPRRFNLLEPENKIADPVRNLNLREISFALKSQVSFGYTASRIEAAGKPALSDVEDDDDDDNFIGGDGEDTEDYMPDSDVFDEEFGDDEEIDEEDEEPEVLPPPRDRK